MQLPIPHVPRATLLQQRRRNLLREAQRLPKHTAQRLQRAAELAVRNNALGIGGNQRSVVLDKMRDSLQRHADLVANVVECGFVVGVQGKVVQHVAGSCLEDIVEGGVQATPCTCSG